MPVSTEAKRPYRGGMLLKCKHLMFLVEVVLAMCGAQIGGDATRPPVPQQRDSSDPYTHAPVPMRSVEVGERHYQGTHTWDGVIKVESDNITYQRGKISASAAGVPEGVTFVGDRRHITLRELHFLGVGDGINIGSDQRVDDFTIDQCHFVNCRTPNAHSKDHLLGSRGYAMFGAKGKNWVIRKSSFVTKCPPAEIKSESAQEHSSLSHATPNCDFSVQYAMRIGTIDGLHASDTRFENKNGKAVVWLMFVHDAVFENCTFEGGRLIIGARPGDMAEIERGDCRNIVFRNCTFNFDVYEEWPASINVFPGSTNIRFENCRVNTKGEWWIEVDSRETRDITWDERCTWNGKPVTEHVGVRSSMDLEQMKAQGVRMVASGDPALPARSNGRDIYSPAQPR